MIGTTAVRCLSCRQLVEAEVVGAGKMPRMLRHVDAVGERCEGAECEPAAAAAEREKRALQRDIAGAWGDLTQRFYDMISGDGPRLRSLRIYEVRTHFDVPLDEASRRRDARKAAVAQAATDAAERAEYERLKAKFGER